LLGDVVEMSKNYFASAIEDGSIRGVDGAQCLTLRVAGGFLEVLGEISVEFS
jgi:hypothetical protein